MLYDAAVVVQAKKEDAQTQKDGGKVMSWLTQIGLRNS